MADAAEQAIDRRMEFARRLARGVAEWEPEDFTEQALTLPFGLSAWMRQCSVEPDEACAAICLLREAVVRVSGLDRATEPRPLMPVDRRIAVINMTIYLDGLVLRACRSAGMARGDILESAVTGLQ